MTGLRDLHTSVFDFATKVMSAVECQHGGSDMSSQVTATIAFSGDETSRVITIAIAASLDMGLRRCVVVYGSKETSAGWRELDAHGGGWPRAGPHE